MRVEDIYFSFDTCLGSRLHTKTNSLPLGFLLPPRPHDGERAAIPGPLYRSRHGSRSRLSPLSTRAEFCSPAAARERTQPPLRRASLLFQRVS